MRTTIITAFCFVLLFSGRGTDPCDASADTPSRVLVLFSYNYNFPSQQHIVAGIEAGRKAAGLKAGDFVYEYIDLSLQQKDHLHLFRELLQRKYAGQTFDLIITIFDSALDFLMTEGKGFMPESPCLAIFASERPELFRAGRKVVQIPLKYDFEGTLKLALDLFPGTKRVVLVAGSSPSDRRYEALARQELSPWLKKITLDVTGHTSLEDAMEEVSGLGPDALVIYSRMAEDNTGRRYVPDDVAAMIAQISPVPVFCLVSSHAGTGAVGGRMVDLEAVGSLLSRAVMDLSDGRDLTGGSALPYVRTLLDWNQVRQWKVRQDAIPADTVFINRPPSLWTQYRSAVTGMLVVILVLSSMIVALMVRNRNTVLKAEIEERKMVQSVAQAANAYNRGLIEVSLDPLMTIGLDGAITDVNLATEKAADCDREELIGKNFAGLFTDPEKARTGYLKAFREGDVRDYALNLRRRDGNAIPVLFNAVVYRDRERQPVGVFAAARDITRLKQAEEAQLALERKLLQAKKAESLGRMAGAIAHLYNNLLAVVMGSLELYISDLPRGAKVDAALTEAMKAARRAADVSGLMLTYLGQSFGQRETLDLSGLCRRNLEFLKEALPDGVTLEPDLPPLGPVVEGNPAQIQQVVNNLVTNAWEAMGNRPGPIRLNVKTVSSADIPETRRHPLEWHPEKPYYACIEVTDTGCGIPPEHMEKLFDPFFTSKFTGRGLGLSVALGVVKAHGGAVALESEQEKGSVFRVFLPVSDDQCLVQADKAPAPAEFRGTGTVLLVEDEPSVRQLGRTMLERMGFDVLEARDGMEAVDVFKKNRDSVRLVLCDLTMPRMSGWETLEALRQIDPDLPMILASGYDQAHAMAGDLGKQPQAFLGKPYQLSSLREAVKKALGL